MMDRLEKLQMDFTRLTPSLRNLHYEDRLRAMSLSSIQRRIERYRIMYIWKILNNEVPNCGIEISADRDSRLGQMCAVPSRSHSSAAKLREATFQVAGPDRTDKRY